MNGQLNLLVNLIPLKFNMIQMWVTLDWRDWCQDWCQARHSAIQEAVLNKNI